MLVVSDPFRTLEACEVIALFVLLLLFAILERLNDGVMLLKKQL
jgi:hypothetical protein